VAKIPVTIAVVVGEDGEWVAEGSGHYAEPEQAMSAAMNNMGSDIFSRYYIEVELDAPSTEIKTIKMLAPKPKLATKKSAAKKSAKKVTSRK